MKKRQAHPFAFVLPFSALIVTVVILSYARSSSFRSSLGLAANVMTVEHSSSMTMHVDASTGKREGLVEIRAEGSETITVFVPSSWELREVRGAELTKAAGDPPSFGVVRRQLPPGATFSFRVENFASLSIGHRSATPLLVLAKRINVITGEIEERSVLVKEGTVKVW